MQDVNNDMDNLFRKAAEQYPLQTDSADWQKVRAGLQNASMPVAEEKEKKKRRFLWLFLLLPLGVLWAVHYKGDNQPGQQAAVIREEAKHGNDTSKKYAFRLNEKLSSKPEGNISAAPNSSSGEIKGNKNTVVAHADEALVAAVAKKKTYQNIVPDHRPGHSSFLRKKNEDFSYRQPAPNSNTGVVNDTINNQTGSYKNTFPGLQPNALYSRIDKTNEQDSSHAGVDETAKNKTDDAASVNTKTDSTAAKDDSHDNKAKLVKPKPRAQTGFYTGLMGSFDISTIKLQRINKTGYGFELLLGYRFSKRISVESGINLTNKKYYSTGKYFDKSRTDIPEASKIIYTNGTCAMFEIPAIVKYDFAQKKKSNWFATAGLSSYIMKNETYSYYANHSGNYYNATKKYSHSGSNLFSVASLSLGYQLQLNKHLSLRAEPYIKMPLSGIGIAKMPITSMGIAAGFTRSF